VEINAGKRHINWTDTGDSIISEKLTSEVEAFKAEARPRRIMMDAEPMDISAAPQAAKLISTTALVQDFIGIPSSLAFIR
jgi:hypothetical protein